MIKSYYRIDFLIGGRSIRLLDFGQWINDEISLPVAIGGTDYPEAGAEWSDGMMEGNAKRSLSFQVRRDHPSHQALRSFCIRHPELVPRRGRGVLQYTIMDAYGGPDEVWELGKARVLANEPTPVTSANGFVTLTGYRIETGSARPLSVITPFPGMPITWYNQPLTSLTLPFTSY